MNNGSAFNLIKICDDELDKMHKIIEGMGPLANVVPYLTKYAAIRASGTLEQSFKTIVADYCVNTANIQLSNFVNEKVRNSSMNPTLDNINRTLKSFDESWNGEFNRKLSSHPNSGSLKSSIQSLVVARNQVAHGANTSFTFAEIVNYFEDAKEILNILDGIII